ncbi:MAG: hypothetical protein M9950_06985 [Thermomicrobiales bacterium]|nr:hypothetical protein [Thermomicrobiales bacterium]
MTVSDTLPTLTTAEAASRLGISVRRVSALANPLEQKISVESTFMVDNKPAVYIVVSRHISAFGGEGTTTNEAAALVHVQVMLNQP